ncbi:MAG: hypothetical protein WA901_19035 [Phormidesmis sp.]
MQSNFSLKTSVSSSSSLESEFRQVSRQYQGLARFSAWLQQSGIALFNFLTGQQVLSIQVKTLADGRQRWTAYDPATDTRHVFDSQQAVRTWLEQRYYR